MKNGEANFYLMRCFIIPIYTKKEIDEMIPLGFTFPDYSRPAECDAMGCDDK